MAVFHTFSHHIADQQFLSYLPMLQQHSTVTWPTL